MTKLATEERVEHAPRAEKIVDDYFSLAPRYRVREKLVEVIADELAEREALVSALRANLESVIALLQEAEHSDDETEKELTDRLFSIQNRAKYIESAIRAALQAAGE